MKFGDEWRILSQEAAIILRALFFCVVTVPAVVLFSVVMLFALRGSLTGQFISEAQSYTLNAPVGMVMVCRETKPAEPPPSVFAEPCEKEPMSAKEYAALNDRTLLFYWRFFAFVAFFGRVIHWVMSESPSNIMKLLARLRKWLTY